MVLARLSCIRCRVKTAFLTFSDWELAKWKVLTRWLVVNHNANAYITSRDKSIKVKVINFASYLESKSAEFDKNIVKMDIEGAEVNY